jgi:hypothetical protein
MPLTPAVPAVNPLVTTVMQHMDFTDAWASAMGWAGAICDRLHFIHEAEVPAGLGYVPPAVSNWSPESAEDDILSELNPTRWELSNAARLLDGYLDLLRAQGLDH